MPEPLKLPPDIEPDTGTSWEDDAAESQDITLESKIVDSLLAESWEEARILDAGRIKDSICKCLKVKGKDYCFAKGARGIMTPPQVKDYCSQKSYVQMPTLQAIMEARQTAKVRADTQCAIAESCPRGQRLMVFLENYLKELKRRLK